MARTILHIDMDAFFASVEQSDNPSIKGLPVIIGSDPKQGKGRGVVSTCSYEARVFGVRSAMPISRAWQLCPQGIYLPPRMRRYSEVSSHVFSILSRYSPLVEPVSIDEAFVDLTGTEKLFGPCAETALKIKQDIKNETSLTASAGIATCKSVAKIASDLEKPDGLTICQPGNEAAFLAPLPAGKLWGAGQKTVERLELFGMRTIGDIQSADIAVLKSIIGDAAGTHLWRMSHGYDDRPVISESDARKSISEEHTFEQDTDDFVQIKHIVLHMADNLARHMMQEGIAGRTITLKIRLTGFETSTRSRTMTESICDMKSIRDTAEDIILGFDRGGRKIRLIGIGISNLESRIRCDMQLPLFGGKNKDEMKKEELLFAMREKYGKKITRGSLLNRKDDE